MLGNMRGEKGGIVQTVEFKSGNQRSAEREEWRPLKTCRIRAVTLAARLNPV